MKEIIVLALLGFVIASSTNSATASRYQENHLTRYYYSGPDKTELVGEADLFCPNLEMEERWIFLFGDETPYFETVIGTPCPKVGVYPNPPPWPYPGMG